MRTNAVLFTTLCLTLLFAHNSQALPEPGQQTFSNSIGMEFVLIPAGAFMTSGLVQTEADAYAYKTKRARFTISKAFYLGKYPVTQQQWEAVMESNPSEFKGPANPVENVSWVDVQEFIERLNRKEGHKRYRLPTEAEWEYAARGGTNTLFFFMEDSENWIKDSEKWEEAARALDAYAWFSENSGHTTRPVGQKKPNSYGLHDIYGNVREWVQDWDNDYPAIALFDKWDYQGPHRGSRRMFRGCSWDSKADRCWSGVRGNAVPDYRDRELGFRLVLSLDGVAGHDPVVWPYHEQNYHIFQPQIAPDNKGLVFMRRLYNPLQCQGAGHGAYEYSQKELRQFKARVKANPRIADPEIVFMDFADNSVRFIDHGWNPVFSRDGNTLLYAHQKTPGAGRPYTFVGNEIRAYDLARKRRATVARPSTGYFAMPSYTDKGEILFALAIDTAKLPADAMADAEREVGVAMADPATGQQKVLYKPVKEHGLHHLVDKFAIWGDACLVLRARPVADADPPGVYAYELVDAGKNTVLYDWGKHVLFAWDKRADFRICPSGELEVYDDDGEWKSSIPGKAQQRHQPSIFRYRPEPAAPQSFDVHSSPDCAHVAVISKDRATLTILSARGETVRRWNAPGIIGGYLAWSPDATHIALVLMHDTACGSDRFDFEEVLVLRVNDLPVSK